MAEYLQPASEAGAAAIYDLIRLRIAWMDKQGLHSWNQTDYLHYYPLSYFQRMSRSGQLYALHAADGPILSAVVPLTEDERWSEHPPRRAYYLHNLVSMPDASGAGRTLLQRVEQLARQNGMDTLRLDCAADSEALNRFYEAAGYLPCGICSEGKYHGILRKKLL